MDNAASGQVARGYAKNAIDLLQLITATGEIRGEEKVGQLADLRWELVICLW